MSNRKEFYEIKAEALFAGKLADAKRKLKPSFNNVVEIAALVGITTIFGPFSIPCWALEISEYSAAIKQVRNQDKLYEEWMKRARAKHSQANMPIEFWDQENLDQQRRLYNVLHGNPEFNGLETR